MLHRGSNCSLAPAMDDRILRCGIISSCQSAATSNILKALLVTSLTNVAVLYSKYPTFTLFYKSRLLYLIVLYFILLLPL